jgi:hypothetical protein
MDIASLAIGAVGLASLATVCADVLKKVESYNNSGSESRLLSTRFDINKAIFRNWAKRVGIISGHALNETKHHPLLDDVDVSQLVLRTLVCISDIFNATETSRSSIDLLSDFDRVTPLLHSAERKAALTKQRGGGDDKLSHSKKLHSTLSARKAKFGWAWGGKDRFVAQVEAFEALLERLRTLVPPSREEDPETATDGIYSFAPLPRQPFSFAVNWLQGRTFNAYCGWRRSFRPKRCLAGRNPETSRRYESLVTRYTAFITYRT